MDTQGSAIALKAKNITLISRKTESQSFIIALSRVSKSNKNTLLSVMTTLATILELTTIVLTVLFDKNGTVINILYG